MTITAQSTWRTQSLTEAQFVARANDRWPAYVLADNDPAWAYGRCVHYNVDANLVLEIFDHESTSGRAGTALETHSAGNTREPTFGDVPKNTASQGQFPVADWRRAYGNPDTIYYTSIFGQAQGRSGYFARFRNWRDGWESTVARLAAEEWAYAKLRTIAEVIETWAPRSDGNAPNRYTEAVIAGMNRNMQIGGGMPDTIRIALSSGHHNDDKGGTSGEYERTGVLTAEIARQMRGVDGFDVRVIQPDDGRGDFPGDLYDAASQVGAWAAEGWQADLFLEVHFEGNGAGDAGRGSFAIYPDWGSDVDVDVRDTLGPSLAMQMQALTGIPPRGNGTMSEKRTGVGSQGHRLGVFRATESFTDITRLIYEYGALTSQADRALINHPDFMQNAARATTLAVAAFYGVDVDREPELGGDDVLVIDNNPFGPVKLQRGFRDHFLEVGAAVFPDDPVRGGLAVFGYPIGDEYATGFGSAQSFQRYVLEWHRENQPPFDIIGTLRGEPLPERAA